MQDVLDEFEALVLPDERLIKRVRSFVGAAWKSPSASLPKMLEDVAALEGAYRLLNNERVSPEALRASHRLKTVARAQETAEVVVVHDTSEIQTRHRAETLSPGAPVRLASPGPSRLSLEARS